MSKTQNWLDDRPTILFFLGFMSVLVFCFCSQLLIKFSKMSNISLNKYNRLQKEEKHRNLSLAVGRLAAATEAHSIRSSLTPSSMTLSS